MAMTEVGLRPLPTAERERQCYEAFLQAGESHDDAAFLRLKAREVYTDTAAAFRRHDPKRLHFGEPNNGFDTPVEVLEEAARVVDVISIQPSADKIFRAEKHAAVYRITGKPILISDWSPATHPGQSRDYVAATANRSRGCDRP